MEDRKLRLEGAVRAKYRDVARAAEGHFPYPVGRASAEGLGYPPSWIEVVPPEVAAGFVGVGNPFEAAQPRAGDRVLDVGSGAGFDAFVAASLVGPTGRVVGIDLTAEMLAPARAALASTPAGSLAFEEASVLALPFPDGAFDLVLSNGVLNLVPDKDLALSEIARVLRPDGVFAAADLLVVEEVPQEMLDDPDAWAT